MPFATRNLPGSSHAHLRCSSAQVIVPARSWALRLIAPVYSSPDNDNCHYRCAVCAMEASGQSDREIRYFHNVLIYQKLIGSDNSFIMILIRLISARERRALCQMPRGHFIRGRWHRLVGRCVSHSIERPNGQNARRTEKCA